MFLIKWSCCQIAVCTWTDDVDTAKRIIIVRNLLCLKLQFLCCLKRVILVGIPIPIAEVIKGSYKWLPRQPSIERSLATCETCIFDSWDVLVMDRCRRELSGKNTSTSLCDTRLMWIASMKKLDNYALNLRFFHFQVAVDQLELGSMTASQSHPHGNLPLVICRMWFCDAIVMNYMLSQVMTATCCHKSWAMCCHNSWYMCCHKSWSTCCHKSWTTYRHK